MRYALCDVAGGVKHTGSNHHVEAMWLIALRLEIFLDIQQAVAKESIGVKGPLRWNMTASVSIVPK
jgi:hypothetical protein